MLPLPESDYTRAQVLASWIELSALAEPNRSAFRGHALESMRDSQLFADNVKGLGKATDSTEPESAAGKIAEAWQVLGFRERALAEAWPFTLTSESLILRTGVKREEFAAYTAMLLIEAAGSRWYSRIKIKPGDSIRHWFEEIVAIALRRLSDGDSVRFGAPFTSEWPASFVKRVAYLASLFELEAREAEINRLSSKSQQDDSLDVVTRLHFVDDAGGLPYILTQCATGATWHSDKPAQPNIALWDRYIAWDGPRIKALAIPFTLREKGELEDASVRHLSAMVFDRIRLSGAFPDKDMDPGLRAKLSKWCKGKFEEIKVT